MTLSPRIQAAIKKVDVAHAELFAVLEDEAKRRRPSGSGRRENGPRSVQSVEGSAVATPQPVSLS